MIGQITSTDFTSFNSDQQNISQLKMRVQDDEAALIAEENKPVDPKYASNGYASVGYLDPSYIAFLKNDLISQNQQLLSAQGSQKSDGSALKFKTLANYQNLSNNLFTALGNNEVCAHKFPGIGVQAAGQILSTASTLANGVMAPILLASGSVFDSFMRYLSQRTAGQDFMKINDSRIANATQCALESLSATYCQARDQRLIAKESPKSCPACQSTYEGKRVIDQDLDSLNSWLTRIAAGSSATSTGAAEDKKNAENLKTSARILRLSLQANIAKASELSSHDPAQESAEVLSLVGTMVGTLGVAAYGTTTPPGVLSGVFQADPSCGPTAYLISSGAQNACPDKTSAESCIQCVNRKFPQYQPTFTTLPATTEKLMSLADSFVNNEVSLVEESNPLDVLSQYTKRLKNFKTPENFVLDTLAYLKALKADPDFQLKVDQDVMTDLQERLTRTACELDSKQCTDPIRADIVFQADVRKSKKAAASTAVVKNSTANPKAPQLTKTLRANVRLNLGSNNALPVRAQGIGTPISPTSPTTPIAPTIPTTPTTPISALDMRRAEALGTLDKIHSDLIQSEDLFFVANTLNGLVQKDVDRRIANGDIKDQVAFTLKLSNSNTLGALIQAAIGRDAAIVQSDSAQDQTEKNVNALANMFHAQLFDAIRTTDKSAVKSRACIRAALVPSAPLIGGVDIRKLCSGSKWESVHPSNEIDFDKMIDLPKEQRLCVIYDYYRKSRLLDSGAIPEKGQ